MHALPGSRTVGVGAVLDLLRPFPGRLGFACRIAVVCALSVMVAETYQTLSIALTAYLVMFIVKPDRTSSIAFAIVFLVVVTFVVGMLILVAMAVLDYPAARVASMAILSFSVLFVGMASKLKPLAAIIALVVGYALDVLGGLQVGELATRGLLYAWLIVAIPAGISILVSLAAGPAPRRLAAERIASQLRAAAELLIAGDKNTRATFDAARGEKPGEVGSWLKLAGIERSSPPRDLAALRQAAASTETIMAYVAVADGDRSLAPNAHDGCILAELLQAMAASLDRGGYPVGIEPPAWLRDAGEKDGPSGRLRDALVLFAEPQVAPPAPPARPGFFVPDAFTNPEYVHHALKTTGAAMICYLTYQLLDWPGIHTAFITCYIVALGTAAETIEKLSLRIVGCLIGAAAGVAAIVYLMPMLTTIGGLMGVVFAAALVSGWVAAGSPRIAYAGFQIAFAFFLCVIQGAGPEFHLDVARDRIVGILFGDFVTYLFFTRLWPVSVVARIDPAIAELLRRLGRMATSAGSFRQLMATDARARLAQIRQDLGIVQYEAAAFRPDPEWLASRGVALVSIAELHAPLLLAGDGEDDQRDQVRRRLETLASSLDADAAPHVTAAPASEPASPMPNTMPATIARLLDRVDDAVGVNAAQREVPRHAPS